MLYWTVQSYCCGTDGPPTEYPFRLKQTTPVDFYMDCDGTLSNTTPYTVWYEVSYFVVSPLQTNNIYVFVLLYCYYSTGNNFIQTNRERPSKTVQTTHQRKEWTPFIARWWCGCYGRQRMACLGILNQNTRGVLMLLGRGSVMMVGPKPRWGRPRREPICVSLLKPYILSSRG